MFEDIRIKVITIGGLILSMVLLAYGILNSPSKDLINVNVVFQKNSKVYTGKFANIKKDFDKEYSLYKGIPKIEKIKQIVNLTDKEIKTFSQNSAKLKYIVDNYSFRKKQQAISLTNSLNKSKKIINTNLKEISEFLSKIKTIKKEKQNKVKEYLKKTEELNRIYEQTAKKIEEYKKKYPNKKEDLTKKDKKLYEIKNNFDKNVKSFMKEENPIKLIDLSEKIEKLYTQFKKENSFINNKINELDHDYTKILIDMKEKPYIQIGRTSWDEAWDFPTETDYIYPKRYISEQQFKYFQSIADKGSIGSLSGRIFGRGASIRSAWGVDQSYINALHLNPKFNFPRGDDSAEFWINDLGVDYYHKYKIIENGKIKETDLVKVPEDFYYKHIKDLGMSIVTKPKGTYEEETVKIATPPGMAYVGNPNYGEWKQDDHGHSFWYYYGMYSFFSDMLGGRNYDRYDYDSYRRSYSSHKPYYGRRNEYGTGGTVTSASRIGKRSSYYRSSSFKKGSFKKGSSFRNIGSKIRGRGPSGGGK